MYFKFNDDLNENIIAFMPLNHEIKNIIQFCINAAFDLK